MILPSIHLNGTSLQELLDQTLLAAHALNTALSAMETANPNARDYYPQGHQAFLAAQEEHQARCRKVKAVLEELAQLAEGIADGGHKAEARRES